MHASYDLHPDPTATLKLVGLSASDVERELILATLDTTHGNRTHAAAILAISIRTLRYKLHEYASEGLYVPAAGDADAH